MPVKSQPFFSDGSPFLSHPLLTPERTEREIDFVIAQTGLVPPAPILDIGCAFGRHSLELARRGYTVTGIDPAPAMIAAAREGMAKTGLTVDFQTLDAVNLPYANQFEAAICLFTTLGQMNNGRDNLKLLAEAARALKPGGRFVVEIPNRLWLEANLKPEDRFGNETNFTHIRRQILGQPPYVREDFHIVTPATENKFRLQYRIFSIDELTQLLTQAGFSQIQLFGSYQGEAFNEDSPVIIAVAKKLSQ